MDPDRILVVEDEVIVARNIASQLNQLGYMVAGIASSGEVAISKALDTHPELVLMDIILKGQMDGITAASCIRKQLDIPIIFLTAYGDDSTLERAKITQPFGYIVKPFTITDLRIGIEIALLKHKLERELRESRDQLATLLNSISDAVIATNNEGIITFINPAAEELTEWQEKEVIGRHISEIVHIVDDFTHKIIESPIVKMLREKKVFNLGEFTSLITKNGKKIPIGNKVSPVKRKSNEISGGVFVFWDLSERRKREYLEEALKKEQEINNIKSIFISTVSHEFRNPLTVIQTAAELLEIQGNNLTESKRNAYFARIYGAVESMEKLMEDILFMGRTEAGKMTYNPVPVKLDEFCRGLIEEFSTLETGSYQINFICQDDPINALMDERLLHYLFVNLLSNAVKYSPEGGRIDFYLSCDLREKVAIFKIKDEGIGIPESEQNQIFESFYRGSNVKLIQGNGLGLGIVKKCVDFHSGEILIDSKVGVGTTFTVRLPLK